MDAFVLLGEPGSGKSSAFQQERDADPENSILLTVRDFVTMGPGPGSEGKTIFIDGLDERRATSAFAGTALDELRVKLSQMGKPRFRISCREADWIASDAGLLGSVSPSGKVTELHLQPLGLDEIHSLLSRWATSRALDPDSFIEKATRRNLSALLGNPLLLNLLVAAVHDGNWPSSRAETYLLACRHMVTEYNPTHRAARSPHMNIEAALDTAGALCALLLLSDKESISLDALSSSSGEMLIDYVPSRLGVTHLDASAVLATGLFSVDGERRVPRHRSIAEYLAGRRIAAEVSKGLPVSRVLALMAGFDEKIVEPLRGLYGWIAAHCAQERSLLIERDPLGLILYGDVFAFSTAEKQRVLHALHNEAQRFRWFRSAVWETHPFGAMGTTDMQPTFQRLLTSPDRSLEHEVLLDCVCDAIEYGEKMPDLLQTLAQVVRDGTHWAGVRRSALDALLANASHRHPLVADLLIDIHSGKVEDSDDELLGRLLTKLYPTELGSSVVLRFLHPRKEQNLIGRYYMFWAHDILPRIPPSDLPVVADQVASIAVGWPSDSIGDLVRFAGRLLSTVLHHADTEIEASRLHSWLLAVSDAYGNSLLDEDERAPIRVWFEANPRQTKALFEQSIRRQALTAGESFREFWRSEALLLGAARPCDWNRWLLTLASTAESESMARYCFSEIAHAVVSDESQRHLDVEVVRWVGEHSSIWPNAERWLADAWTCSLDDFRRTTYLRQLRQQEKKAEDVARRKHRYSPHLAELKNGTAPPGLLADVAAEFRRAVRGNGRVPPEVGIAELLVVDVPTAAAVIDGISLVLKREDLPTYSEVLRLRRDKGKVYWIQDVCLLAAELEGKRVPEGFLEWSDSVVCTMTAFLAIEGRTPPDWFCRLAQARADIISEVLLPMALESLRSDTHPSVLGDHTMRRDARLSPLAQRIVPALIHAFPKHATGEQLNWLNSTLIPAAQASLDGTVLNEWIALQNEKSVDSEQRIAWLVASLTSTIDLLPNCWTEVVGSTRDKALALALALEQQFGDLESFPTLAPLVSGAIFETLARHTAADRTESRRFMRAYSPEDRAADVARSMLKVLASSTTRGCSEELARLQSLPELSKWRVEVAGARHEQAAAMRAATFRFASAEGVANVLANQSPASARDMAALIIDQISVAAAHIRFDDSNSIEQFWRETSGSVSPKVENSCRDVLLGLLRPRLLLKKVLLEKEAQAAGDKRADLQGSSVIDGERVVVPIEIKKEDHPAVWYAWRDQLAAAYTTTPGAQGIGVYLVLWFGATRRKGPTGKRPQNAEDMAGMLSELVGKSDSQQCLGLVLDLSLPTTES